MNRVNKRKKTTKHKKRTSSENFESESSHGYKSWSTFYSTMDSLFQERQPARKLLSSEWSQPANIGNRLGPMLDQQIQIIQLVTRATQTDWNWAKMALRWRNGRILTPSNDQQSAIESSCTENDHFKYNRSSSLSSSDSDKAEHTHSLSKSLATSKNIGHSSKVFDGSSVNTEGLASIQELGDEEDEEGHVEDDSKKKSTDTVKLADLERLNNKEVGGGKVESERVDEEKVKGEKTRRSTERSSRRSKPEWGLEKATIEKSQESLKPEDNISESLNFNDKCVDTIDLNYDPYDPNMIYTPSPLLGLHRMPGE